MDLPIASSAVSSTRGYSLIDCDVHPLMQAGMPSIYPYMTESWRRRFQRKRASPAEMPMRYRHPNGSVPREDARPPNGGVAGSDPAFMIADLLDRQGVDLALLNCLTSLAIAGAQSSVEESVVLASAANDYYLSEWLPRDPRFRFAMTVPSQDPLACAAEIRRVGGHEQIAAVSVPPQDILMGNRYWWPVYEAAEEASLAIYTHVAGAASVYISGPRLGPGVPNSYTDRYLSQPLMAEAAVISLVFSGTLAKFPRLNFIFAEFGFLWLLPLLWRMDRVWRGLRYDVPWVSKSPIEYVNGQLYFGTQPLDEPANPDDLEKFLALLGGDQLLFCTDYPHWDNDMPGTTLHMLPAETRRKVFAGNAIRALRL